MLNRYLEEVEQLCADRGIVKEDTVIGWMVYYTSPDEEEFFRTVRCDHGDTVKAFVSALRKEYPGAEEDERSSMQDLLTLISHYQGVAVWTKEMVGEYYRAFRTQSERQLRQGHYTVIQRNHDFARAFSPALQHEARYYLLAAAPEVLPIDGYNIDITRNAMLNAVEVIQAGLGTYLHSAPSPTPLSAEPPEWPENATLITFSTPPDPSIMAQSSRDIGNSLSSSYSITDALLPGFVLELDEDKMDLPRDAEDLPADAPDAPAPVLDAGRTSRDIITTVHAHTSDFTVKTVSPCSATGLAGAELPEFPKGYSIAPGGPSERPVTDIPKIYQANEFFEHYLPPTLHWFDPDTFDIWDNWREFRGKVSAEAHSPEPPDNGSHGLPSPTGPFAPDGPLFGSLGAISSSLPLSHWYTHNVPVLSVFSVLSGPSFDSCAINIPPGAVGPAGPFGPSPGSSGINGIRGHRILGDASKACSFSAVPL